MGLEKYTIKTAIREDIEAEEILLDAEAVRFLEDKGKIEQPIKGRNFIIFFVLIIITFLVLLGRAGYLQIVKGDYYRGLAEKNRIKVYPLAAPRGIIYDKAGQPLVYNLPNFNLTADLADFLSNSASVQDGILKEAAEIIAGSEGTNDSFSGSSEILPQSAVFQNSKKIEHLKEEFRQIIDEAKGKTAQAVLADGLSHPASLILESLISGWPGLRLEKNIKRQYVFGPALSHIIGFTGEEQSYNRIGKAGLELQYEGALRGELGEESVEVDVFGQTKKKLTSKPSLPGKGLILSISQPLQEKIYQALNEMLNKLKLTKAAAVVLNPQNGAVLGLVSLPSFDNNLFAEGISQIDYNVLMEDPGQPIFNRAVAGQYPPGSTIKPLIAAAALEEKVISPEKKINDLGEILIVNQYNPQVVYRFKDWKVHGLTDIIKAIAESCNVYFYSIGGGYGEIEGLGILRIKNYLNFFGLGKLTGIDLPYEEDGLIPSKNWKESVKNERWFIGDTYNAAIGQGDIAVTPLQMALAAAVLVNGGILYQPQIVDKIVDSEKNVINDIQPKIIRSGFIGLENLETVKRGMRQAVISGSAQRLKDLPVEAAGKTGTAQFGKQNKTHAWFTGFAPYENPEIVLAILIEGGGEGHAAAVPVAREVFEWYFNQ